MKMQEALHMINHKAEGFMVCFSWLKGEHVQSDFFPDKDAGEDLIETEIEAWVVAKKFADATKGKVVNVYVADSDYTPVKSCDTLMISNR